MPAESWTRRWRCLRSILPALALVALASCSGSGDALLPPPRHVLLVVIDTQRADHLSCYGCPRKTSPAIDALAQEGVLFAHAVSQASWTLPSMVSMMTSAYVGEETLLVPDDRTTLAEVFREHGFATGAFICNDLLSPENRFERGFDAFEWKLVPYGTNEPILAWIRAHKAGPTFTYVHLNEVHDDGNRADGTNYGPEPIETRARFRKSGGSTSKDRLRYYDQVSEKLHLAKKDESLAKIDAEIGGYDDDVGASDARIGEIVDEYKKLGLWDSTAVIVGADHGEGLWTREQFPEGTRQSAKERGEPATLLNTLQMTHGSQAAIELVHVPLVLRAPGLRSGKVDAWIENVDVGPTLLDLCGIPPPKTAQGRSRLALARDPKSRAGVAEAVFSYTRYQSSTITQEGMQLLHPTARGECNFALAEELYDLSRDPEARTNLVGSKRDVAEKLARVAGERTRAGIRGGSTVIGPNTQKSLSGLGYIDSAVVDAVGEQLAATSTEEILKNFGASHDCLVRLQMLRALKERELGAEAKAALRAVLEKETSTAVQEAIRSLLSR